MFRRYIRYIFRVITTVMFVYLNISLGFRHFYVLDGNSYTMCAYLDCPLELKYMDEDVVILCIYDGLVSVV